MEKYFEKLFGIFEKNLTKTYLVLANVVLVVFSIWFANVGFLPFKNVGDLGFFMVLWLVLALYRPGWAFVLFVGSLALENVNLAPAGIGMQIRPFQLLFLVTFLALVGRFLTKKMPFALPKFVWIDTLPILFVIGGFLSALFSVNKAMGFKQAIVATSFVGIYFLVRIFVQSLEDLKRIMPFFLSTGLIVALYAIWQNFAFIHGWKSFEIMPGRPNGTFVEADWLGIYLAFVLTAVYAILYKIYLCHSERSEESRKITARDIKFGNLRLRYAEFMLVKRVLRMTCYYAFLVLIFMALILTVSRSAWVGAIVVTLGWLKLILLYGKNDLQKGEKSFWRNCWSLMTRKWNWNGWITEFLKMLAVFAVSAMFIFVFHLTNFQLGSRAQSSGGLQKITVACELGKAAPEKISNVDELAGFGCRHINLEDIEKEKNAGNIVMETLRPDPNVGIRARIWKTAFEQIKKHPIMGIGWGSISQILGTDSRGAGLNASNLFLEVWLGSGLLGFLSIVILLGHAFIVSMIKLMRKNGNDAGLTFIMLALFAIIIPNLFNSGIFLGFVWAYLGVAVSLLLASGE